MSRQTAPFHGWRVVAAAFVVAAFGWGVGFYGASVYLELVREARGWPVSLISGAVTVHFLAGVLVVANLPALHRRYGLPTVTVGGSVLLALGVFGWSVAEAPWQLYGAALASGAGWVALGAAGVNAMVAPWFVERRPAALAMAYNGASVGGVIFSPLWIALAGWVGFPLAAALVGVGMIATVAMLAFTVLAHTPASLGQVPDGEAKGAAPSRLRLAAAAPASDLRRDPAFLTLAAGMALALSAQVGLLAHLVSMLAPSLGAQGAGLAAGLSTAAAIVGRTLVGWLMPAYADRRAVAALSLLVQAAGCALLMVGVGTSLPLTLLGVVALGLGLGNATSLPPLVAQAEFSPEQTARVVALIVASAQAAYAFAPALLGLVREAASDAVVFGLAILVQAAAAAVYLAGRGRYAARSAPVLR